MLAVAELMLASKYKRHKAGLRRIKYGAMSPEGVACEAYRRANEERCWWGKKPYSPDTLFIGRRVYNASLPPDVLAWMGISKRQFCWLTEEAYFKKGGMKLQEIGRNWRWALTTRSPCNECEPCTFGGGCRFLTAGTPAIMGCEEWQQIKADEKRWKSTTSWRTNSAG